MEHIYTVRARVQKSDNRAFKVFWFVFTLLHLKRRYSNRMVGGGTPEYHALIVIIIIKNKNSFSQSPNWF